MPSGGTARRDPATHSVLGNNTIFQTVEILEEKRDVCKIRGMGTVTHKEPALSRSTEREMMPAGITDSQREFISLPG